MLYPVPKRRALQCLIRFSLFHQTVRLAGVFFHSRCQLYQYRLIGFFANDCCPTTVGRQFALPVPVLQSQIKRRKHHPRYSTFQQETAPVLKDLKADEPDVYWGIVTVIYMRCRQIGPYKLGIKRTFHLLIDELDGMLFQWYPERADAHETAFNLKGLSYGTNLWKIIEYCVILFRRYTEADFSKYASQIMRLFNWGEVSYWRIPGCPYRQGSEVWLFSEQSLGRATNGFYIVLRLEAGKDNRTFLLKDALNYCFWTIDQDGEPPILQASRGASTHKEWCFYLYEYDEENSLLHLDANPDTGNLFGLPETL